MQSVETLARARSFSMSLAAAAGFPQHRGLKRFQSDPQGYARDVLGVHLTPDQDEMLQSILLNRRTLVKASHAIGKTFLAAVAASWWYDCWNQHISYITAPTWEQSFGLTFKQLKTLRRAKGLPGVILDRIIRDVDKNREGDHYVKALNAEKGEGFQGEHSAPMLVIIEEGVGVPKYIWDAIGGLMTNPECFVGETSVSASKINAATSRFYQGRVIKIATANGRNLTVTPNHPILTKRGWVAAQCVNERDQLVAGSDVQTVTSRITPNKENVPTAISEVFTSFSRSCRNSVREGSGLQFHGDGSDSKVHVINPNRLLGSEGQIASAEPFSKLKFHRGHLAKSLNGGGSMLPFGIGRYPPLGGAVRGTHVLTPLQGRKARHADNIALAHGPYLNPLPAKGVQDARHGYSFSRRETVQGDASGVVGSESRGSAPFIKSASASQGNSSIVKVASKGLSVGSDLASQMVTMFPSLVAFDQVVEVRDDQFSGQVYNLQTDTSWYFANGIIAHNCRVFAIGNPTDEATEFGLASESITYNTMSISALNHPNIQAELECQAPPFPDAVRLLWLYEMLEKECEQAETLTGDAFEYLSLPAIKNALEGKPAGDEKWIYMPTAYFQGRVLGEFPTQADQQVIPKAWLKNLKPLEPADTDLPEIGCDIARFGDDRTTIFTRRGPCFYAARELRKMDNVEVETALKDTARDAPKLTGKDCDPKKIKIKIDVTGGLGTGPHDHLKAEGYNVVAVNSSSKANNEEQYKNKRSELWFDTRDRAKDKRLDLSRLRKELREKLERELSAPKYKAPGQKVVEDKAQMKKRLGYSPDLADGANLAMAPDAAKGGFRQTALNL